MLMNIVTEECMEAIVKLREFYELHKEVFHNVIHEGVLYPLTVAVVDKHNDSMLLVPRYDRESKQWRMWFAGGINRFGRPFILEPVSDYFINFKLDTFIADLVDMGYDICDMFEEFWVCHSPINLDDEISKLYYCKVVAPKVEK